ncbi:MAG: preprotein translocase subunit SecY [Candidatus Aenigmarchaeota archaeon]|nr:preprotein translocase subunit SecY [Candidatus Aenigmarchaeota archaeon]
MRTARTRKARERDPRAKSPRRKSRMELNLTKHVEEFVKYVPSVKKPTYKETVNSRLKWTGIALLLYFILSFVQVYGLDTSDPQRMQQFQFYEIVLGSKFGSLMTLGIGPIVTGGILLQLLVGSKIIDWDTSKEEGRKKFNTWNKFLSIALCFIEAIAFVLAGALPVTGGAGTAVAVMMQLAAGAILVVLLDELVSKWGFGSGISLFIAAGVGSQVLIRVLSPFVAPPVCQSGNLLSCLPTSTNPPTGLLWVFALNILSANAAPALIAALPIAATIIVFFVAVYMQNIQVEIPLTYAQMRGFGRSWGLKLLYTSNIPVILTAALVSNMQLVGRFGLGPADANGIACGPLGCFEGGTVVSGLVYYLTAPGNLLGQMVQGTATSPEFVRALTYMAFMAVSAMLFSRFWITTSGMDAQTVAEQISGAGMQIPGYRKDAHVMAEVLNRYIPALAAVGGLLVGLLAGSADIIGALGTGTGMLLTVMIVYQYYEELSSQRLDEAHPLVRRLFGE